MSEAPTFVTTKDIRGAIEGRETEILDGLGIPWRDARPHIDCPNLSHVTGQNDWRWDDRKKKAFCTCNPPNHADGIFDVILKCDGLPDFDAAKLRAAELLNREDLIRRKGGKNQRTDAFSLLHPPSSQEDRSLPRNYLAHRLGIVPNDVLMPTTPATGFKALGYFDPPPRGGKVVHVGDHPCCIFGQVDVEGKIHAHRIYLKALGAGKADLGAMENGKERDPKKSAKTIDKGESTSGRAVVWGDIKAAPRIILTEGIETAAAVAHAYRAAVVNGLIAVASAISAGGVEAFKLYAGTQRVTVAADRDEKAKPSRPAPSRRGERAARVFGLLHHKDIDVDIALPGQAGEAIDWLDVMVASGEEAVRAGIEAASPYAPSQAELDGEVERQRREAELRQVEAQYPVPQLDGHSFHYAFAKSGRIWLHKTILVGKGEDKTPVDVAIASPFTVRSRVRFVDNEDAYGLRVVLQDMDGRPRSVDLDRRDLARVGSVEARSLLFQNGLLVQDDGERIAAECLKGADPIDMISMIRRPGWTTLEDGSPPAFIGPDGTIFGHPTKGVFELSGSSKLSPAVSKGGSLAGWTAAVETAVCTNNCEHWTLGVIAGFAGVLIALCEMDTCGINLSGLSSSGKTTAQRLAVSAWSKPVATADSLFRSARSTVNSVEAMASRAHGTILALDELAHVSGSELAKIIYTISGNVGKSRMTSGATLRDSYTWRTFTILSAETSLGEKIRSDGGEWTAGQAVRVADVDITGSNRRVDAATMGKINAIIQNFGHAGPAFVKALIQEGLHKEAATLRSGINDTAVRIATGRFDDPGLGALSTVKPDSALVRSAIPFAALMTAGKLAKSLGVLPPATDVTGAIRWAWARFSSSSDAVALDPQAQAFANLRRWIAGHWGSSIHEIGADKTPIKEALGWFDADAVYLTDHRLKEAAGNTMKENEVSKALKSAGFIVKTKDSDCNFVNYVPRIGKVKAYALSRDHFGRRPTDIGDDEKTSRTTPFQTIEGGRRD